VWKKKLTVTFIHKESRETILSSVLLFAGLAILAPLARAQQCGYAPANLTFNAIYGNCDLAEFTRDSIGGGTPNSVCRGADSNACPPNSSVVACDTDKNTNCEPQSPATPGNKPGEDSKKQTSDEKSRLSKPADFNRDIYYKNKLEFSLDVGWLPINIPFPFDVFEGDPYKLYPLRYTLVPVIASLRWHMTDIAGPWILRGNWDLTCSGSYTAIPRGPETRYFSYIMGIRRNFVPRNWRVAPYWDTRLGLGDIDAKGPEGVKYAQGQDFTFTANMGSGVRYNFNPRYAISAGLNYMHISNAGLSGKSTNYGINVYGPMVGLYINLRTRQPQSDQ
jgi:hypothetical protein